MLPIQTINWKAKLVLTKEEVDADFNKLLSYIFELDIAPDIGEIPQWIKQELMKQISNVNNTSMGSPLGAMLGARRKEERAHRQKRKTGWKFDSEKRVDAFINAGGNAYRYTNDNAFLCWLLER